MGRERIMGKDTSNALPSYTIYLMEGDIVGLMGAGASPEVKAALQLVEVPPQVDADYGMQLNRFAGISRTNPVELAKKLAQQISVKRNPFIAEAFEQGPFLNFKLDMVRFGGAVTSEILDKKDGYGKESLAKEKRVVIDMSAPNIAKRMNYGHLRSTIIGDALANLYRTLGYDVVRDNHIGDWGTQFGKQIEAIKRWGSEKELKASDDPIGYLQDLYVKFHEIAENEAAEIISKMRTQLKSEELDSIPALKTAFEVVTQEMSQKLGSGTKLDQDKVMEEALKMAAVPEIEEAGRKWFLKLEQGDPETRRLWKICIDLSMKEFNRIYQVLGVDFELALGESFYEDQMQQVLQDIKKSGVGKMSHGALIVDMKDKGLSAAIVQKSDGATVYMTRDLATAIYREKQLRASQAIYVVGEDQKHYFQQLFEILRRLGHPIGDHCEHVYFGMVRLPEGKMSTRKGRTILLKDVIDEVLHKSGEIIDRKSPELAEDKKKRDVIVRQIAIGALKWNDLSQDPRRSIEFHWEKALNFEGYGSPYVQYTAVRAKSILEAAKREGVDLSFKEKLAGDVFSHPAERALLRQLASYPKAIRAAQESNNPSQIAIYVFELAKRFSTFYKELSVLKGNSDEVRDSRLRLVAASQQIVTNALGILGIEVPEKM